MASVASAFPRAGISTCRPSCAGSRSNSNPMAFWSGLRRLGRNRHYNRGIVHYNRGEYAEAVHAFEEALSSIGDTQDPDYSLGVFYAAEARGNLALAHLRAGDLGAAEQELRRALDSNPDYADLRYHLA